MNTVSNLGEHIENRKLDDISDHQFHGVTAAVTKCVTLHSDHDVRILGDEFDATFEAAQAAFDNFEHALQAFALVLPRFCVLVEVCHNPSNQLGRTTKSQVQKQKTTGIASNRYIMVVN